MPAPYSAESTADDVTHALDLSGKTYLVTGSSSGLGAETARVLAKAGGRVIMVARDLVRNQQAAEAIRAQVPDADLAMVAMDLADLASIRRAATEILERFPRIDALINNAGFVGGPKVLTAEGVEAHLAVNHIGPFLFSNLLVPALKAAAPSRIVLVASNAHRAPAFDLDDLDFTQRPYDPWAAYAQSKRATVLYAVALSRRLQAAGVTVNVLHPGVIRTDAFRHFTAEETEASIKSGEAYGVTVKSLGQGAATQAWAATAPELAQVTGTYLEDCQIAPHIASNVIATNGVIEEALDPVMAERLWDISERIVGETFASA